MFGSHCGNHWFHFISFLYQVPNEHALSCNSISIGQPDIRQNIMQFFMLLFFNLFVVKFQNLDWTLLCPFKICIMLWWAVVLRCRLPKFCHCWWSIFNSVINCNIPIICSEKALKLPLICHYKQVLSLTKIKIKFCCGYTHSLYLCVCVCVSECVHVYNQGES